MKCPICAEQAALCWPNHPGYRDPTQYDIYSCMSCDMSFAEPFRSDDELYQLIYECPASVPGYFLYELQALEAKVKRKPLDMLAATSPVHWGVRAYLREHVTSRPLRIAEVGCGLGYLTHALTKLGYDAIGLDISAKAVGAARTRYGDHYLCTDLFEYSRTRAGTCDVVIMMEVIEHVSNPLDLVRAALRLLVPNGDLIITTPNKSAYPASAVWVSDLPPVHLSWFSERAITVIAERLHASVRYIDLRGSGLGLVLDSAKTDYSHPVKSHILAADGEVIQRLDLKQQRRRRLHLRLASLGLWSVATRLNRRLKHFRRSVPAKESRQDSIFAILTPKPFPGGECP